MKNQRSTHKQPPIDYFRLIFWIVAVNISAVFVCGLVYGAAKLLNWMF